MDGAPSRTGDVPGAASGVLEANGPFDRGRARVGGEVVEGDGGVTALGAAVDVAATPIVVAPAAHRVGARHAAGQGRAAVRAAP